MTNRMGGRHDRMEPDFGANGDTLERIGPRISILPCPFDPYTLKAYPSFLLFMVLLTMLLTLACTDPDTSVTTPEPGAPATGIQSTLQPGDADETTPTATAAQLADAPSGRLPACQEGVRCASGPVECFGGSMRAGGGIFMGASDYSSCRCPDGGVPMCAVADQPSGQARPTSTATPTSMPTPTATLTPTPSPDRGICQEGMTLRNGDSCSYSSGSTKLAIKVVNECVAYGEGSIIGGSISVGGGRVCGGGIHMNVPEGSLVIGRPNADGSRTISSLPSSGPASTWQTTFPTPKPAPTATPTRAPQGGDTCEVGMNLNEGEFCTIDIPRLNVGTDRFEIRNGSGCYGGICSGRGVNLNGFEASKNSDGSWTIGSVPRSSSSRSTPIPTATSEPEEEDWTCSVGLVVRPGASCVYPGGDRPEFSVDSSGRGRFLFFTAGTGINARNTTVSGVVYDFAASRQDDGSWVVEAAGDSASSSSASTGEIDYYENFIQGRVLGPDGEPLTGLGLWAWQGNLDNSGWGTTGVDGKFLIQVPDGAFTLDIYTGWGASDGCVGWFDGDSGITGERSRAARVAINGANVEGVEIRLPKPLAELGRVQC